MYSLINLMVFNMLATSHFCYSKLRNVKIYTWRIKKKKKMCFIAIFYFPSPVYRKNDFIILLVCVCVCVCVCARMHWLLQVGREVIGYFR